VPWDLLSAFLAAVILTYVWRFQDLFPVLGTLEVPTLASLGTLVLFMANSDPRRRLRHMEHPITKALVVILILSVLSVPWSVHRGRSFDFILSDLVKTFLIFVILACSLRGLVDLRRFLGVLLLGGAVYALYVELNITVGMGGRLGSLIYYDANDLGMCLVTTLPVAVFFALRGRNALVKLAAVAILAVYLLVLVKTGSRGAFLGLLAVTGFLLVFLDEVPVGTRMGVVVAGAVGFSVFAGERYWELMSTLLNPSEDYNWSGQSDSGRMEVWTRGVGYMLKNPLLGVGVRGFPIAEGTISELAGRQQFGIGLKWSAAHNSFIQVGAELGILGLIAYCVALVQGFKSTYFRSRTVAPGDSETAREYRLLGQTLAASLLGYLVTAFFLSQAYAALLFVLLALIVGFVRLRPDGAPAGGPEEPEVARLAHRRPRFPVQPASR
jgi:O-antigen ligase